MSFTVGQTVQCNSDVTQTFVVSKVNCHNIDGSVQVIANAGPIYAASDVLLYIPHRADYYTAKDGQPKHCVECCLSAVI